MHAIADVNAGLVDDMIKPRLHRLRSALTAAHQRIAALEAAPATGQTKERCINAD